MKEQLVGKAAEASVPLQPLLTSLLPKELALTLGLPSFRGKQLFQWLHQHSVESFEEMSNLSKELRSSLKETYGLPYQSKIVQKAISSDGTVKFLLEYPDGAQIETVLLQDGKGRKTICISSQVGCPVGCTFCSTGTMGLRRNLLAGEIVEQFIRCKQEFGQPSHIVFMGMGEPLLNIPQVAQAIAILHHTEGAMISLRRMTLSTCGLPKPLEEWISEGPAIKLALSLHSAVTQTRNTLIPPHGGSDLPRIRELLLNYQNQGGKRITLEYLHLPGVNDTKEELTALTKFCKGLSVLVNIIPWNPVAELPYRAPTKAELSRLTQQLSGMGLHATTRMSKGMDIAGACGQLVTKQ